MVVEDGEGEAAEDVTGRVRSYRGRARRGGLAQLTDLAYRRANKLPIDESVPDVEWRLEWVDDLEPEVIQALITPEAFDLDAANQSIRPMIPHSPED